VYGHRSGPCAKLELLDSIVGLDLTNGNGNTYAEHWRMSCIPEAGECGQLSWLSEGPQLNYTASPPEVKLNTAISLVLPEAMRPLIKLQQYDGTGSLEGSSQFEGDRSVPCL